MTGKKVYGGIPLFGLVICCVRDPPKFDYLMLKHVLLVPRSAALIGSESASSEGASFRVAQAVKGRAIRAARQCKGELPGQPGSDGASYRVGQPVKGQAIGSAKQ